MSADEGRAGVWDLIPVLAALALCAAAAFWVSDGVRLWDADTRSAWHHYEYLAEGFAHGHTYLSRDPDPELLALRDPYSPEANVGHKLWDASLYRGRYYLYFGPAPALLMLPWRAVTGHEPPQRVAVFAAAVADLVALALILWGMRRKYFPALSTAALAFILVVAFHATWLPVVLRRSAVWELPIVSAVACLSWAVYFLWRYHDSGGKAAWALLSGVSLALLIGCRATYLFSAGAVVLLFLVPAGVVEAPARRINARAILAGLVVFVGGIGLLLYNHERFGAWLDFGQKYQLWGKEYRGLHFFSAGFIPFNAQAYVLSLPQFGPYFPFVHPFFTETAPKGYMETEDMYGILFMMPVHLAGLAACAWAWRNRRCPARRPAVLVVAAAAGSSVLSALVLFSFGGACSRYTAELLCGWTIATAVGLMAVFGYSGGSRAGRFLRGLASVAACWTIVGVWLASAEYRGYMKQTNPRAYVYVAHALDYPAYWWARSHSVRYGPLNLAVSVPPSPVAVRSAIMASGRPQMVDALLLDQAPGRTARLVLAWNEHHVLDTPPIALQSGMLRVRVDAPWLYPPPEDPYWDDVPEPARSDRQALFALSWGTSSVRIRSAHYSDPVTFEPTLLLAPEAGPALPSVESATPAEPPP